MVTEAVQANTDETPPERTDIPVFRSRAERVEEGRARREVVPRSSHASWQPPSGRADPIETLEASNRDRVPELIPIRYGRMLASPFAFLRGSAGLMASDLATTPTSGFHVQACGDCHLLNYSLLATTERNLIFENNDFDETLPAPWEWDLKRLAVSFTVAARDAGLNDDEGRAGAVACARAFREHLRDYSKMSPLEVWYDRLDMDRLIETAPGEEARARREKIGEKARTRIGEYLFPQISAPVGGRHRLIDQPPLLFHTQERDAEERFQQALALYRESLPDERRVLFDRYSLVDFAMKVVGIGSVGTRCFVALFFSADNRPLLLQFKEARRSVLEPYAGKSIYANHGQRVVVGQRLMQSSSDIFLGWTRGHLGFDFFGRQLRDMKMSATMADLTAETILYYADLCGWTLARAQAKSGDAAVLSGYLGKSDTFDDAIGDFALAYADQNEHDHAALVAAVRSGRVQAVVEADL